ncbi:MAG: cobalamin biosynthesis protein CobD [Anaerolinea sp. 4484_236]|nr:MAG: cobalamin biosynthesis protein CobD [Anaerolinea sp. 4484_236]
MKALRRLTERCVNIRIKFLDYARSSVLFLALAIDLLLGDPPNRFHPVAWMGNLIAALKKNRPYDDARRELTFGAKTLAIGGGLVVSVGLLLKALFGKLPRPFNWLAEAVALKSMFALRGLDRAAGEVQAALDAGDLAEAQRLVSWHLVSRETKMLDESGVAAATIESVAENASDSLIAPIFFYLIGGLPLAFLYRFLNTADSMLGYRTPEYEWLGKIPARLDDLLNIIPSRLTAGLIALAAPLIGTPSKRVVEVIRRDARLTESPNAGYPMSAMAGALGVELSKDGHYSLGADQAHPESDDVSRARTLLFGITGIGLALTLLTSIFRRKSSR